jgi:lysophospholipase L1-like esterase
MPSGSGDQKRSHDLDGTHVAACRNRRSVADRRNTVFWMFMRSQDDNSGDRSMHQAFGGSAQPIVLIMGMSLVAATTRADEEPLSPLRFSKQIEAFAQQDVESPPKPGAIVFVGSSSIRLWNLAKSFGDLNAINRGFGGSQISDVLHYADEVILKYKPRKVVFFCGGNDLNNGKSPEQVAADFQAFTKLLFQQLPKTELIVLAVKPSPLRWGNVGRVRKTNDLLRAQAEADKRIIFLDGSFDLLLDEDGEIREELFVEDRLHLNDDGYMLWANMLAPHLGIKRTILQ